MIQCYTRVSKRSDQIYKITHIRLKCMKNKEFKEPSTKDKTSVYGEVFLHSCHDDVQECDVSHDSFIRHITCKVLPPLCVSASGHKDSPPGSLTHLHSHPRPLLL